MNAHTCRADGCSTEIPRRMLLCMPCWRRVPRDIQRRVAATYQIGQWRGLVSPSAAWCEAADEAIAAVRAYNRDDR